MITQKMKYALKAMIVLAEETAGNALFAAAYRANATVARTQNELLGTILDLRS